MTQSGHWLCAAAKYLMPDQPLSKYSIKPIRCRLLNLGADMRRREFITLLGGAAAWPLTARAQQHEQVRRIGVLTNLSKGDPEDHARNAAFLQGLQQLGWTVGRNVQIDYRWGAGNVEYNRRGAAELVALAPDVFLATGTPALEASRQATRTVPIVFMQISDPLGAGVVDTLSRPGGNVTGFSTADYNTSGKLLELLMEIAPNVKRAAVLRDDVSRTGVAQWAAIQTAAPRFGVELRPVGLSEDAEIERAIAVFARDPNGGLIVPESAPAITHRKLIIGLAARHRLPAVYAQRFFVTEGGLISYGHDTIEPYRRAAGYVDRILKGEKPADLPVQAPTKFELVINLKTAKALGLAVPPTLLGRADEEIE
jgi:putative tryptophan/tyrosine transport system substrate-binding protein